MSTRLLAVSLCVAAVLAGRSALGASAFALEDRDTVVFLGDSNTVIGGFAKVVEAYATLRFPMRRITYVNAGIVGDTAQGGMNRFQRDVLDAGATVVVVVYGVNDLPGDTPDAAYTQAYLDGIRGIVTASVRANVRAWVCTYPPVGDPAIGDTSALQTITDQGTALAVSLGAHGVDLGRPLRAIDRRLAAYDANLPPGTPPVSMHAPDGVHLNDLGHDAVAWALLKAWGAPADVSSVTIDAAAPALVSADNATVSDLQANAQFVAFTRLDQGLPIDFGFFEGTSVLPWIPFRDDLNRYLLTVRGLMPGWYRIEADGQSVGTFTDAALAASVNLSGSSFNVFDPAGPWIGGPWVFQAQLLNSLVDARSLSAGASATVGTWFTNDPLARKITGQSRLAAKRLALAERTVAMPTPYRFIIQRAVP